MLKREEVEGTSPYSCWNSALDGERVFVLLARDAAAPAAIRAWVIERLRQGKVQCGADARQLLEALECAERMDAERAGIRAALGK